MLHAFRRNGADVASGKSGPDYIDPTFHRAATGRDCVTLDGWAMAPGALRARAATGAGLTVIEGAMGLFDGPVGRNAGTAPVPGSTGHLASALELPVVLVVDARKMGQSAGAIVSGLAGWADGVEISGVILNRVASARHEAMLRSGVERTCPVLGIIPEDTRLSLPSRHLGLVQACERPELEAFLEGAADVVSACIDLAAITSLSRPIRQGHGVRQLSPIGQRIAVARDIAFSFTYAHMLNDWQSAGAEIVFFSPLEDEGPGDDCDAVFLPGGYPELHAGRLAAASGFRSALTRAVKRGALIYGECGGFMVLGDALIDADGETHRMAGLLRLETSFAERRRHLGYRLLDPLAGPWSEPLAAHEFHYSTVVRAKGRPLFQARDAQGKQLPEMGLVQENVMGSYAHIIAPAPEGVL